MLFIHELNLVPDMPAQISQNRKHREHPNGPWLAKSGMVPRTARSHDRLSTSSEPQGR